MALKIWRLAMEGKGWHWQNCSQNIFSINNFHLWHTMLLPLLPSLCSFYNTKIKTPFASIIPQFTPNISLISLSSSIPWIYMYNVNVSIHTATLQFTPKVHSSKHIISYYNLFFHLPHPFLERIYLTALIIQMLIVSHNHMFVQIVKYCTGNSYLFLYYLY